jgi:hypothetical protein
MHEVAFVIDGIAVGLVWLAIWTGLLHFFGVAPFGRKVEDRSARRERLKRLGRLKYILAFGVFGQGLAFGPAMITVDFLSHRSAGLVSELIKLVFLAVFFGLFMGFWGWQKVRDPVPFPPVYPPTK